MGWACSPVSPAQRGYEPLVGILIKLVTLIEVLKNGKEVPINLFYNLAVPLSSPLVETGLLVESLQMAASGDWGVEEPKKIREG